MKYSCPCCGYYTFSVPKEDAIAYICPVCFWENDIFTLGDDEPSDENRSLTLNEARENFKQFGACSRELLVHVRPPKVDELTGKQ
ncbi:CPCC family cysteine-rich protein [Hydrogenoanaerobacterium sp.]|uniref:CPCC family cysteine-rich protein n=1 Tax=Hydrogenoanaerobacterium sp. TaxID=2953763 RepID=UPI0028A0EF39|nr:CPCC family cysteine-rich protein [Hydrogenoanaerobacterium sp.]